MILNLAVFQSFSIYADDTVKLVVSNVECKAGETVSVDVDIVNNPGIVAYELYLDFDNSLLTADTITNGSDFTGLTVTSNLNDPNVNKSDLKQIKIISDGLYDVSTDGTLFTVNFKVNENISVDESDIVLTSDIVMNSTYDEFDVVIENGKVTFSDNNSKEEDSTETTTQVSTDISTETTTSDDDSLQKVNIAIDDVEGKVGDTVSVDVNISNNPGIVGYELYIDFDNSLLTIEKITNGADFSGLTLTSNINDPNADKSEISKIKVIADGLYNATADGTLFTLTFNVNDGASINETEFVLTSGIVMNSDYDEFGTVIKNGKFTLTSSNDSTESTTETTTVSTTESTTETTTVSTTESTTESTTVSTTESTTESTTASTTESTTKSTTESTTQSTTESTTESTTNTVIHSDYVKVEKVGENGLNFVAGIDTLNYKEVGFIFEANGKTVTRSTKTVYTSIKDSVISKTDLNSEYVFAYTITDIDNVNTIIKATPYAIDLNGNRITFESAACSLSAFNSGVIMMSDDSAETDIITSDSAIEIEDDFNSDNSNSESVNNSLPLAADSKKEVLYIDEEDAV
jgi:hypothetical protein